MSCMGLHATKRNWRKVPKVKNLVTFGFSSFYQLLGVLTLQRINCILFFGRSEKVFNIERAKMGETKFHCLFMTS